ncbi:hypothetical protein GQ53DRAFT_241114 [Thozetella sp. PMI_491]|nr:hypothetical protein GQ53DRAFT_241114 [Thozetella sp. PMI_491]
MTTRSYTTYGQEGWGPKKERGDSVASWPRGLTSFEISRYPGFGSRQGVSRRLLRRRLARFGAFRAWRRSERRMLSIRRCYLMHPSLGRGVVGKDAVMTAKRNGGCIGPLARDCPVPRLDREKRWMGVTGDVVAFCHASHRLGEALAGPEAFGLSRWTGSLTDTGSSIPAS